MNPVYLLLTLLAVTEAAVINSTAVNPLSNGNATTATILDGQINLNKAVPDANATHAAKSRLDSVSSVPASRKPEGMKVTLPSLQHTELAENNSTSSIHLTQVTEIPVTASMLFNGSTPQQGLTNVPIEIPMSSEAQISNASSLTQSSISGSLPRYTEAGVPANTSDTSTQDPMPVNQTVTTSIMQSLPSRSAQTTSVPSQIDDQRSRLERMTTTPMNSMSAYPLVTVDTSEKTTQNLIPDISSDSTNKLWSATTQTAEVSSMQTQLQDQSLTTESISNSAHLTPVPRSSTESSQLINHTSILDSTTQHPISDHAVVGSKATESVYDKVSTSEHVSYGTNKIHPATPHNSDVYADSTTQTLEQSSTSEKLHQEKPLSSNMSIIGSYTQSTLRGDQVDSVTHSITQVHSIPVSSASSQILNDSLQSTSSSDAQTQNHSTPSYLTTTTVSSNILNQTSTFGGDTASLLPEQSVEVSNNMETSTESQRLPQHMSNSSSSMTATDSPGKMHTLKSLTVTDKNKQNDHQESPPTVRATVGPIRRRGINSTIANSVEKGVSVTAKRHHRGGHLDHRSTPSTIDSSLLTTTAEGMQVSTKLAKSNSTQMNPQTSRSGLGRSTRPSRRGYRTKSPISTTSRGLLTTSKRHHRGGHSDHRSTPSTIDSSLSTTTAEGMQVSTKLAKSNSTQMDPQTSRSGLGRSTRPSRRRYRTTSSISTKSRGLLSTLKSERSPVHQTTPVTKMSSVDNRGDADSYRNDRHRDNDDDDEDDDHHDNDDDEYDDDVDDDDDGNDDVVKDNDEDDHYHHDRDDDDDAVDDHDDNDNDDDDDDDDVDDDDDDDVNADVEEDDDEDDDDHHPRDDDDDDDDHDNDDDDDDATDHDETDQNSKKKYGWYSFWQWW